MAKASAEPEAASQPTPQPAPEEPVKSIEDDGKPDSSPDDKDDGAAENPDYPASEVTEDQWKAMMDVVMAIYNYREEECVPAPRPESLRRHWLT